MKSHNIGDCWIRHRLISAFITSHLECLSILTQCIVHEFGIHGTLSNWQMCQNHFVKYGNLGDGEIWRCRYKAMLMRGHSIWTSGYFVSACNKRICKLVNSTLTTLTKQRCCSFECHDRYVSFHSLIRTIVWDRGINRRGLRMALSRPIPWSPSGLNRYFIELMASLQPFHRVVDSELASSAIVLMSHGSGRYWPLFPTFWQD